MRVSIFEIVQHMTSSPIMLLWWLKNIPEDKQEEVADKLRTWLKTPPNRLDTVRCGDWSNKQGFIRNSYTVAGLTLTPEKSIELYNFLNKPVMIVEHYAYLSNESYLRETNCLDTSTYNVEKVN